MHMHHNTLPASTASCLCTDLRKASRAVTRAYDRFMDGTGMSITQFAILGHLDRHGKVALSRMAEAMVMDRTSLYRALAPLQRQGWIEVSEADQRAKTAALSDDGRAAMTAAMGHWQRAQEAMSAAIGTDELQGLAAALGGIVAASQALPA